MQRPVLRGEQRETTVRRSLGENWGKKELRVSIQALA